MSTIIGGDTGPDIDRPLVILKLVGGEQVIGRQDGHSDSVMVLSHPRTLVMINQNQLAFAPFMFATDNKVAINNSCILSVGTDIPSNIADSYVQAVTGIQLARSLPR